MIFLGRYGVAETFSFPVIAAGAQNFQNSATIAAGDALVSTDGGATANADNIPAVTPAAGDTIEWVASASEMTGKRCVLIMSDVAGSEWEDQMITVYTYGHASAHIPLDLTALIQVAADVTEISGDATAADNLELDYDGTGFDKANSTIGTATTVTGGATEGADGDTLETLSDQIDGIAGGASVWELVFT